jgi:bacterioferritin
MGTKAREIITTDVDRLVERLNSALADEWLAYYQYWIGAQVVKGLMRGMVAQELMEHAGEELEHAEKLTTRIVQLGGTPLLSPKDWFIQSTCGYEAPTNMHTRPVVEQNLKGERCAIGVYSKLMKEVKDSDPMTYGILFEILQDEEEHEEDLQMILEDMKIMMQEKTPVGV